MELRRELLLTIGGLVLLNLLLAFGSIGLFMRMGPAIERILQENVYSIVATEEILAEFAEASGGAFSDEVRHRVRDSLDRAKTNVTEEEERSVLASLERYLPTAMTGDPQARRQLVAELRRLIRINRDAMQKVDEEARRLGGAGAWAAVLVGFISFLLSLFVVVQLQCRFLRPLIELYEVVDAAHQGDRLRRCRAFAAPREVVQVLESVNRLLDERLQYKKVRS